MASDGEWVSPERRRGSGPSMSGKYHDMGYAQRGFLSARSSVLTSFVDVRTTACVLSIRCLPARWSDGRSTVS